MSNGGGFGGGGRRKMGGAPPPARSKDRDNEDLVLFRDMFKRDKDRVVSLLQPVSDEFEANGSYPLYGMSSSQKKGPGFGFHGESEKNDYDWLKTPPATPLFPSLEMESKNAPELVVHRELPILQPLSRFAGNSEEAAMSKSNNISTAARPKSPTPRPRFPGRSVTPSGRPSISVSDHKKNIKTAPIIVNPKLNQLNSSTDGLNMIAKKSNQAKTTSQKESQMNFLAANLSKNLHGTTSSSAKTKPTSRGVSPLVKSTIPAQIPGFSNETPSNLKTDRSASRGRSVNHKSTHSTTITAAATTSVPQKPESSNMKAIGRTSCSPSVTRGRKVAPKQETGSEESNNNVTTPRGARMVQSGNIGQVFGSRMVDKLMNARKTSVEEREAKPKLTSSLNEGSGFGRMMSKSSLDIKRDSVNTRQVGITAGRRSVSTSRNAVAKPSGGSHRVK